MLSWTEAERIWADAMVKAYARESEADLADEIRLEFVRALEADIAAIEDLAVTMPLTPIEDLAVTVPENLYPEDKKPLPFGWPKVI